MNWIKEKTKIRKEDKDKNIDGSKPLLILGLLFGFGLFLTVIFQSEIVNAGNSRSSYIAYYSIAFIAISSSYILFKLGRNMQINAVILSLSVFFGLWIAETVLTRTDFGHRLIRADLSAAYRMGVEFDKRTKFEVVNDFRKNNVPAVPSFHSSSIRGLNLNELFPLGGVSNSKTVHTNETGTFMIYQSDRFGFNNPDTVWNTSNPKWMLFGDSFVQGSAVQEGEDIASQLRLLTDDKAINLGIGGNGPLTSLATLTEYTEGMRPEKILWFYMEGNDLAGDLEEEKRNSVLMEYLSSPFHQSLKERQQEIDLYISKLIEKQIDTHNSPKNALPLATVRSLILSKIRALIHGDKRVFNYNVKDPIFKEVLTKAKNHANGLGAEFIFVYLPFYERYAQLDIDHKLFAQREKVLDLVTRLNIPIIDIHERVFQKHPDPISLFPLRLPNHYSAEGYQLVAKSILSFFKNQANQ